MTSELEDPFGTKPNDLPLDAFTRIVDRAVLEFAGEPLPDVLEEDGAGPPRRAAIAVLVAAGEGARVRHGTKAVSMSRRRHEPDLGAC
ncbi:MAG: hypothetical protein EOO71_03235 [Myxococcaceae bacterium]|nr:MAG: hypothetical protein EOO71_03235 [Myxococcaceae bacterium]